MASVTNWSTTAASNTSVGGISTDGNVTLVNQVDNMFRGLMAEVATSRDDGTINNTYPRGYLFGLEMSNNSGDLTNDIDIAAGECVTSDSPYWRMALASALTKRLDAAWAVGTGNGGLDTGSIANTTYHVWLIARSDTGVVDALFSTSATSPTMPTNYDRKRRIGSIIRQSGAILRFLQNGDIFTYRVTQQDRASTSALSATTLTLTVPTGIVCFPLLMSILQIADGANVANSIGSAGHGLTPDFFQSCVSATAYLDRVTLPPVFSTNTSAQVIFGVAINAGTIVNNILRTLGYIDPRGRV